MQHTIHTYLKGAGRCSEEVRDTTVPFSKNPNMHGVFFCMGNQRNSQFIYRWTMCWQGCNTTWTTFMCSAHWRKKKTAKQKEKRTHRPVFFLFFFLHKNSVAPCSNTSILEEKNILKLKDSNKKRLHPVCVGAVFTADELYNSCALLWQQEIVTAVAGVAWSDQHWATYRQSHWYSRTKQSVKYKTHRERINGHRWPTRWLHFNIYI